MEEVIDYQALYEQVRDELETARITILSMRHRHSPLDQVDARSLRKWVMDNYFIIIVAIMVISVCMSFVDLFKKKGDHDA